MARIAINGFGRIGRLALRAIHELEREDVTVVMINDLGPVETNAHLLKYDSVHGAFPGEIKIDGDRINAGRGPILVRAEHDPARLPWSALDVDVVLECTGRFRRRDQAALHLEAGARRVLISAPDDGADLTVVFGVNHDKLDNTHRVVSNASCTTNCLVPVADVLHKVIGISSGFMTTVHSYTGDQHLVDTLHKDLRRARAGSHSMIPTSTGAARAVGHVLPELEGKLDGVAIRVPTPNVSLIDFKFTAARDTTVQEINDAMIDSANGRLKGVLETSDAPLVSIDFNHNPHSAIFDLTQTRVIEHRTCRVLAWYDNEWAYACRMLDVAAIMSDL